VHGRRSYGDSFIPAFLAHGVWFTGICLTGGIGGTGFLRGRRDGGERR